MTTRRNAVLALAGLSATAALRLAGAQPRVTRIGMLGTIERDRSPIIPPSLRRLAELGYVEGKNLTVDYRSSDGDTAKLASQARELVAIRPDLLMSMGPLPPMRAFMAEKTPIPVVFCAVDYDPVDTGIVTSYNRPGGNVTGVFIPQPALAVKRFEIARELLPAARRFLVMDDAFCKDQFAAVAKAAAQAGIALEHVEFTARPYDYAAAFARGRKAGAQIYVGLMSPLFFRDRAQIASTALKHNFPSLGGSNAFAESGFVASYGAPLHKVGERGADIAARILNGAKAADTPVEQVNDFEFAVNLKTAKSLGIRVPSSILVRAGRVIE